jgi:hypothetical protein
MQIQNQGRDQFTGGRMSTLRVIGPALIAAVLAAGCGTSDTAADSAPSANPTGLDVSVLRQADHDYEPEPSPDSLVKTGRHDVIAAGTVVSVQQGRHVSRGKDDEHPLMHVVMKVRVTEKYRERSAEQIHDRHVYVELWQGARYNDKVGTPEHTLRDWNKAIPNGSTVMLFLSELDSGASAATRVLPAGARLMSPDVQGIVFENRGKLLGGIEDLNGQWTEVASMKQLKERVKKAVGTG